MYLLNLVLGCWVADDYDYGVPGQFLTGKEEHGFKTIEDLIKHWNNCAEDWEDIHRPCIVEHFELYETLPENWKTLAGS
jgi:hypothetical protein